MIVYDCSTPTCFIDAKNVVGLQPAVSQYFGSILHEPPNDAVQPVIKVKRNNRKTIRYWTETI